MGVENPPLGTLKSPAKGRVLDTHADRIPHAHVKDAQTRTAARREAPPHYWSSKKTCSEEMPPIDTVSE